MPDSAPVSPAAQAEPPELWWSPSRGETYERNEDDGRIYYSWGGFPRALPDDAVRLVPAPGPDTATAGGERLWSLLHALRHAAGQNAGVGHSTVAAWVEALEAALVERGRAIEAYIAAGRGVRTDGETPQ